jgi:hypothetical protein
VSVCVYPGEKLILAVVEEGGGVGSDLCLSVTSTGGVISVSVCDQYRCAAVESKRLNDGTDSGCKQKSTEYGTKFCLVNVIEAITGVLERIILKRISENFFAK